jgi:hypothetical protein
MRLIKTIVAHLAGQRKAQRSEPMNLFDMLDANLSAGRLVHNRWPVEAGHGWGG